MRDATSPLKTVPFGRVGPRAAARTGAGGIPRAGTRGSAPLPETVAGRAQAAQRSQQRGLYFAESTVATVGQSISPKAPGHRDGPGSTQYRGRGRHHRGAAALDRPTVSTWRRSCRPAHACRSCASIVRAPNAPPGLARVPAQLPAGRTPEASPAPRSGRPPLRPASPFRSPTNSSGADSANLAGPSAPAGLFETPSNRSVGSRKQLFYSVSAARGRASQNSRITLTEA